MKWLAWLNPRRLAWLMIGAPLLASALYLYGFAADRYVSESIVSVRQASGGSGGGVPGIALSIAGIDPPSREDTLSLRQYMHSLGLLGKLEERLKLRAHYEQPKLDPFFRLWAGTSREWFLDYYRARIELLFDDGASLLTVRVQAFDPQFAQALNQAILDESEAFVNAFSQRVAREQMKFAEGELARATERVKSSQADLMAFQARHGQIDPAGRAQAASRIEGDLQAQITRLEAEQRALLAYLSEDAVPARALRQQLDALRRQLVAEQERATRGNGDARVNQLALQFQTHLRETKFADDAYNLALAAVENARIEAGRKIKSLAVVEPASLPDSPALPRRLYDLATLLAVCVLLYGGARLALSTIREHQD
jgi:capsular polysaccharide transport system permease protein